VVTQGARDATAQAWLVDGSAVTQPVSQVTSPWVTADNQTLADNAPFTDGTSKVFMGGYILDEVAGTALAENDAAAARIDSKRAVVGVIEDATTRGRRARVTAAGNLGVDGSAVTQPVSGSGTFDVDGDQTAGLADVGKPVKIGGRASSGSPTPVTDGQRANAFFDLSGRLAVAPTRNLPGNDGFTNSNIPQVNADNGVSGPLANALYAFNGTSWDRLRSSISNGLVVDVSRIAGTVTVGGSVSVSNFPATQSVTQGTSPWVVDASGFTVPISAVSLPLPTGAATDAQLVAANATLTAMLDDIASMRDSLNEVAFTAILQREQLERAA
jgi:hypothetical protein